MGQELSKKENAIISEKRERSNKLVLYMGVLFILIAIGATPYYLNNISKIKSQWKQTLSEIDSIAPASEKEIRLKLTLENSINYAKSISVKYHILRLFNEAGTLFIIGLFAIGIYFKSRSYLRIIRKLQS
jgi:hypothetical protein